MSDQELPTHLKDIPQHLRTRGMPKHLKEHVKVTWNNLAHDLNDEIRDTYVPHVNAWDPHLYGGSQRVDTGGRSAVMELLAEEHAEEFLEFYREPRTPGETFRAKERIWSE